VLFTAKDPETVPGADNTHDHVPTTPTVEVLGVPTILQDVRFKLNLLPDTVMDLARGPEVGES
jgi:hypothetical protein